MADELRLEPDQYMTPIAQYVRGVCCAVATQRIHISRLVDELRERMNATVDSFIRVKRGSHYSTGLI